MLGNITTSDGQTHPRREYAEMVAVKHSVPVASIYLLLRACELSEPLPENMPQEYFSVMEEICLDVARSGGEPDTTLVVTEKRVLAPSLAQECTDENIVKAARETTVVNGFEELKDIFDFGSLHDELVPKKDAIVTPMDYAKAIGYGISMGEGGAKITARALRHLHVLGKEDAITQIAADRGLSYSTISALLRTELRVPLDHPCRKVLPMTVMQEICNARYSKDEKENEGVRLELLNEATKNRWDSDEARSATKMRRGHDAQISDGSSGPSKKALQARVEELEEALKGMMEEYLELANSGDARHWDPEEKPSVIASRKALGIIVQPENPPQE